MARRSEWRCEQHGRKRAQARLGLGHGAGGLLEDVALGVGARCEGEPGAQGAVAVVVGERARAVVFAFGRERLRDHEQARPRPHHEDEPEHHDVDEPLHHGAGGYTGLFSIARCVARQSGSARLDCDDMPIDPDVEHRHRRRRALDRLVMLAGEDEDITKERRGKGVRGPLGDGGRAFAPPEEREDPMNAARVLPNGTIETRLVATHWNEIQLAERFGLTRTTLLEKLEDDRFEGRER